MSRGILFVRTPDVASLQRWLRENYPLSDQVITGTRELYGYSISIVPVDCSLVYDCDMCGKSQCPGCGMQVEINLFTGCVLCIACARPVDRGESGYTIEF